MIASVLASGAAETAEVHNQLPVEPIWIGVMTLVTFVALLVVTFAFRNVHTRH